LSFNPNGPVYSTYAGIPLGQVESIKIHHKVIVVWGTKKTFPDILQIENDSWALPWCEEDFLRLLRQRNCISMVAISEATENIVGFMVYQLAKRHITLLNMAVTPARRRMGVGSQMIDRLWKKLSPHRRSRLIYEARESNLPAQLFLRSQGFRCNVVNRRSFADTGEDGYLMAYQLHQERGERLRGEECGEECEGA
jgi:ribosomal-protein-alanine N-acetyltransferase